MSNRCHGEARCAGKEVFEVKPVILGGDPTDPANKAILCREDHIKAVRYWNRIIAALKQDRRDADRL